MLVSFRESSKFSQRFPIFVRRKGIFTPVVRCQ
jgi:hypothetical protein